MMFFERVVSPLKKGVDVKLAQRTVLVGPNGSGKSSVLQALELATGGCVNELEGRNDVRAAKALSRLFNEGSEKWAEAILNDGTKFRWTPGEHNAPRVVHWPVQDLLSILRSEESTVRSWLEGQVTGAPTEADVLALVDKESHDVVKRLIRGIGRIDFLELAKEAKREAKSLRANATRTEKTIDRLVDGVPPALLPSERETLQARLAQTGPDNAITSEQKAASQVRLDALLDEYLRVETELAEVAQPDPTLERQLSQLRAALKLIGDHLHLPEGQCWVCGTETPDLVGWATLLLQAKEDLEAQSPDERRRVALLDRKKALWPELQSLAETVKRPVMDQAGRDAVLKAISADDAARRAWANANAQRLEVKMMRTHADHLTDAAVQLEKEGMHRLQHRKEDFEKKVSRFLPKGDTLGVDLSSARVGFQRGSELHSALSASELTRALLALCAASPTNGGTLSVLAPEDRSWDPTTLSHVMQALSTSDTQILLMSTVKPAAVDGWTIIEVG